jgi:hypothetical protein
LNEGVVLGRIPIISRTGVGVVIFLSRGMMEMMQQVVHLCWQRKSKSCCVVFHFVSKDRVVLGKCKLLGKSIKYQVVSIKKVVPSTKYQVGDSGNWMCSTSSFKNRNSAFDIFNSVPRISYLELFTLYLVLGTLYYFPNSILTELMQ